MPREMLADGGHPSGRKAVAERGGEMRDGIRVAMEGPIADHGARSIVEVEDRRETEIDTTGAELRSERPPDARRLPRGGRDVAIPELAEPPHRRNRSEALAEALDAPALVIDRDQRRRVAQRADLRAQRFELRPRDVVAREQDRASRERVR